MQYVINLKSGRIVTASEQLLTHRHCILAGPRETALHVDHGVQYFKVHKDGALINFEPIPPAGKSLADLLDDGEIKALDKFLQDESDTLADGTVEVTTVATGTPGPTVAPELGDAKLSVKPDFNLDVDISHMNRGQLQDVARKIDGLLLDETMKVKPLRQYVGNALALLKAARDPKPAETPTPQAANA